MMTIRLAAVQDAEAVQALYAPYVRDTTISFELAPPSIDEMRQRIAKSEGVLPWIICENETGQLIGYAYASKHRERAAYQWSVDVSVYVNPALHRGGMGRRLYAVLFDVLRLQGYANAFAGIALPNEKSIGLHRAMGFESVGIYRQVGYKLGAWHDVSWWGLALQAVPPNPPPVPTALKSLDPDVLRQAGLTLTT